jgi:hypothetical protein
MWCVFENGICQNCLTRRDPPYPKRRCTPGLGDVAAMALSAIGITEARVARLAAAAGIEDCACHERREWMNAAGRRLGIGASTDSDLTPAQNGTQPNP